MTVIHAYPRLREDGRGNPNVILDARLRGHDRYCLVGYGLVWFYPLGA